MKLRVFIILSIFIFAVFSGCIKEEQSNQSPSVSEGFQYGVNYTVTVIYVIDGDTFDAEFPNGSTGRVRLLGVDTPEKYPDKNKLNEYDGINNLYYLSFWAEKATNFTESWLDGKEVYIQFDDLAGFKGYYGRWLCYVYLKNGTDFNAELLKRGYARVYEEGNFHKKYYYLTLQDQAMENKVGLWKYSYSPEEIYLEIVYVHYDAEGDDRENLNDEYVVIKNEGDEPVYMGGFTLSDEANHVYTFPLSFVLDVNSTVTVHTGYGTDTEKDLYWNRGSPVWNNDHDTAYLRDNFGNILDSCKW